MESMIAVDFLAKLDSERRKAGESFLQGTLVKEYSADGLECTVVYSHCTSDEIRQVIQKEASVAETSKYVLEWKVYDHDTPDNLKRELVLAGFEPSLRESVMFLRLSNSALGAFDGPAYDIRRIRDPKHLADVAAISHEVGRSNVADETRRLGLMLEKSPQSIGIYVAYIDSEAVACGRLHINENSEIAELSGGRTKTKHRKHGLYRALVRIRLMEAIRRSCKYAFVDALPTSEAILNKRGFEFLVQTQPFLYRPKSVKGESLARL